MLLVQVATLKTEVVHEQCSLLSGDVMCNVSDSFSAPSHGCSNLVEWEEMTSLLLAFGTWIIPSALAQEVVVVDTGIGGTIPGILGGIVNVLFGLSTFIAFTVFMLGGFYTVASGGNEQILGNGKKLMRFALIGLAIILGSWLLLSTFVNFFLQPLG